MKRLLRIALQVGLLTCAPLAAFAAGFPDRAITIVVPYAAGGSNDLVARVVGHQLATVLGVPIVVDNAAGASGTIGAAKTIRSKPDGYTLLLGSNSEVSIARLVNPAIRYDGQRDLVPLQMIGSQPMVLVTGTQSGIKDVDGFLGLAKGGDVMHYGTSGVGTPLHLSGELIRATSKVKMEHVPYKGGAPAINDLMGGQVDFGVLVLSTALPFINSGRLQAIGVTSATRSAAAPGIPALAENKTLSRVDMRLWFGLFAPKGTPADVNQKLSDAVARALSAPEVKNKLFESGVELDPKDGPGFEAFIARETESYRKIVIEAGIKE